MQGYDRDNGAVRVDCSISSYTVKMRQILEEIERADASTFMHKGQRINRSEDDLIRSGLKEIMALAAKAYRAVKRR